MTLKKRIFILTDSLGCPRKEIKIKYTWVDKLLRARCEKDEVYFTYCKPGLEVKAVDVDYLREYEPDILICQFGICDASRRALTPRERGILRHFPFVRDYIKKFCKNHHYAMTKKREVHYSSVEQFREVVIKLVNMMSKTEIFFLEIAPPGPFLLQEVYAIADDVKKYNEVLKNASTGNAHFVNLYDDEESYLLADGHHLNIKGNDIVYRKVMNLLED